MDLWLDLLFSNAINLSSMLVIFAALGLMLLFEGFSHFKVMNDKSPHYNRLRLVSISQARRYFEQHSNGDS